MLKVVYQVIQHVYNASCNITCPALHRNYSHAVIVRTFNYFFPQSMLAFVTVTELKFFDGSPRTSYIGFRLPRLIKRWE